MVEMFSYSLGDAIDWKLNPVFVCGVFPLVSYSLGDAIDWKPKIDMIIS